MFAGFNCGNHFANVATVFGHRVAGFEIPQGDLVPQRNVHQSRELWSGIAVQSLTLHRLAGFDIDDRDTDIIFFVMHQKLRHIFYISTMNQRFLQQFNRLDKSINVRTKLTSPKFSQKLYHFSSFLFGKPAIRIFLPYFASMTGKSIGISVLCAQFSQDF